MKVESKGHTTIIKDTQSDIGSFLTNLTNQFKTFEGQNIIIDLLSYSQLSGKDIAAFLPLSQSQKKARKSFVIAGKADNKSATGKVVVVPSLQEAHDMIEMDEIERDLGF